MSAPTEAVAGHGAGHTGRDDARVWRKGAAAWRARARRGDASGARRAAAHAAGRGRARGRRTRTRRSRARATLRAAERIAIDYARRRRARRQGRAGAARAAMAEHDAAGVEGAARSRGIYRGTRRARQGRLPVHRPGLAVREHAGRTARDASRSWPTTFDEADAIMTPLLEGRRAVGVSSSSIPTTRPPSTQAEEELRAHRDHPAGRPHRRHRAHAPARRVRGDARHRHGPQPRRVRGAGRGRRAVLRRTRSRR